MKKERYFQVSKDIFQYMEQKLKSMGVTYAVFEWDEDMNELPSAFDFRFMPDDLNRLIYVRCGIDDSLFWEMAENAFPAYLADSWKQQ